MSAREPCAREARGIRPALPADRLRHVPERVRPGRAEAVGVGQVTQIGHRHRNRRQAGEGDVHVLRLSELRLKPSDLSL